MNIRHIALTLSLALLAAACTSAGGGGEPTTTEPPGEGAVDTEVPAGEPAPDVELEFFDGSTATLADFRGQPVVLNFWASWCPACVAEMPDFEAVHQDFAGEVVFIGVDMQDVNRQTAERFVADTGVTYPIADDPTGAIYAEFGGFAMPTTIFIDADGNITDRQDGAIFEDQLTEKIIDLFGVSS